MSRVDPDYDPTESQVEDAIKLLATAARVPLVHYKSGGNGNGFQRWVLGLMMLLVVAGVTGVVAVEYNVVQRLTTLEVKVDLLLMRK